VTIPVKTVLIVGAGRYQRAVIRRAKELGLRVVAVDRNPDAPGFQEADIGRVVDFADADAVLAAVSDLEIDGVTTVQAERAVPVIARIADALGVPGIGAETARAMTHKATMRGRLEAAGVPQPRFVPLATPEEASRAAEEVGFPAVLKPVDASGQFGVFRVESLGDVVSRLPETLAVSPTGNAILEELVVGTEMNGIVIVQNGEVLSVTLCDRLHPPGQSFGVSWIHLFPPSVEGAQLEETERVALEVVVLKFGDDGLGNSDPPRQLCLREPRFGAQLVNGAGNGGGGRLVCGFDSLLPPDHDWRGYGNGRVGADYGTD